MVSPARCFVFLPSRPLLLSFTMVLTAFNQCTNTCNVRIYVYICIYMAEIYENHNLSTVSSRSSSGPSIVTVGDNKW